MELMECEIRQCPFRKCQRLFNIYELRCPHCSLFIHHMKKIREEFEGEAELALQAEEREERERKRNTSTDSVETVVAPMSFSGSRSSGAAPDTTPATTPSSLTATISQLSSALSSLQASSNLSEERRISATHRTTAEHPVAVLAKRGRESAKFARAEKKQKTKSGGQATLYGVSLPVTPVLPFVPMLIEDSLCSDSRADRADRQFISSISSIRSYTPSQRTSTE
jgi:hypothetical protein